MDYKIIRSNYEVQFCGAIEKAIAEGWQLQGGVAVVQMPGSGVVTLYQAVVKPAAAPATLREPAIRDPLPHPRPKKGVS